MKGTIDMRLPINIDHLVKICKHAKSVTSSYYMEYALKAMFSLAFFALLRVGEYTVKNHSVSSNKKGLHLSDIEMLGKKNNKVLCVTMKNFKHNKSHRPITLQIERQSKEICPVRCMTKYLAKRESKRKPLFVFPDGESITQSYFCKKLKECLESSGLSSKRFEAHSLRIGGATQVASLGFTDAQIQAMGRWKSGAFKKYIRIPTISN